MKTILIIIRKEFKQIIRNKAMLPVIFLMPLIQLLFLSSAATYDIKQANIFICDYDNSTYSKELADHLISSGFFQLTGSSQNFMRASSMLEAHKADLILIIENGLESNLINHRKTAVQLDLDAINGSSAGVIQSYAISIIKNFAAEKSSSIKIKIPQIEYRISNHYNPRLNYRTFMIPGIMVLLISVVGMLLTAMGIAKEKEIGTIDQLNVTPIKKYHFLAGKLIPVMIIGFFELIVGLFIAFFIFKIPILGNMFLIFAFTFVYLVVMLSFGLIISIKVNTQQQAMFVAYFFMMLFIFLSGLFTPLESMPLWAQKIAHLIPLTYFIEIIRAVMLKGADFKAISHQFWVISIYAAVSFSFAVWQYKKVNNR